MNVALGVLVWKNKLNRVQIAALTCGAIATLILALQLDSFPWIALTLALTFCGYGVIHKIIGADSLALLTTETSILFFPAIFLLIYLDQSTGLKFLEGPKEITLLLALCGIVTAIPLLLFSSSAKLLPFTILGLIQYLSPAMQFLIAVAIFNEPLPTSRLLAFIVLWIGLGVLALDALRSKSKA